MQCTITLSLFILRLRVVVCQDTSKMQGVEKNLDFLVCFCDIIYSLSEKAKHHSWEFCKMVLLLNTLCDMAWVIHDAPIYYQCKCPDVVICGSSHTVVHSILVPRVKLLSWCFLTLLALQTEEESGAGWDRAQCN